VGEHIAIYLRNKDEPATITVNDSNMLSDGTTYVVYNEIAGSATIDVQNNWWGQTSGPHAGAVTAGVDYTPWRTTTAPQVGITTPPVATFTTTPDPTIVQPPGTEYTFDASACTDVEDYTSSLEVCWDWDNNGACDTSWTTTKTTTHVFATGVAEQTVRLVVRDTDSLTSEATQDVVLNSPPTAAFTVDPDPDTYRLEDTVYTFDASTSSDVEDDPADLEVCWDWDNSGDCDTSWTTTKTATHSFVYADGAVQTVRLVVRDTGSLTDEATRDIHVLQNLPPTASFTFTQTAWNLIYFDASASTDDY
jgi:ketosteroid isomerase-like protein